MPKNKNEKARLVVDANAWISSLLTPKFRFRLEIVFGEAYALVVSEELFDDLRRAMRNRIWQEISIQRLTNNLLKD